MERFRARRRFERGRRIEAQEEEGREERRRRGGRRGMEDRSGRAGRVTYKKNAMDDFFFSFHYPSQDRKRQSGTSKNRTKRPVGLVLSQDKCSGREGGG
jgi:hypothetical protein